MLNNSITLHPSSGRSLLLTLSDQALSVSALADGPRSRRLASCLCPLSDQDVQITVPYRQIINATFSSPDRTLEVVYLYRTTGAKGYGLIRHGGSVNVEQEQLAAEWLDQLLYLAYEGAGVKRFRKLRVLVNPFGGKGKGAYIYAQKVEPIFRAAGCILDITMTTHSGHAYEIAKDLSVDDYDALVTVSGDGLVHEVMNGYAKNSNPRQAFSLPIAPIPTGSGNGLSLNLLGPQDGFDVVAAALNAIKGLPMQVDAFSVTQNGQRTISFMSQAMGLMADLDIGTEHLRWMGDTRFIVGLLYGILLYKSCPVRLSYKAVETDKTTMVENLRIRRAIAHEHSASKRVSGSSDFDVDNELPPLKYSTDSEGWTTLDGPLLYIYAGKGPYVGRDYMAFPVSLPDDGLIDITIMGLTKRSDILRAMTIAGDGEAYWLPNVHYIKARAYRIEPLKSQGNLSIDGEAKPFENFQVEVHEKLATLLSLYGHYAADFPSAKSEERKGYQRI